MIENEVKIVLRSHDELEAMLSAKYGWHDIEQGYLNPNNRIREITHQNGLVSHVFSFKQRLPNGRNIEIESEDITRDDFNDLWEHTQDRLIKRRVSRFLTYAGGTTDVLLRWDIDFPRWRSGNKYFVMAEVEMPADMETPPFILEEIVPYVVYTVPRDDNRFSARKLSDDGHAKQMAQRLGLWPLDS